MITDVMSSKIANKQEAFDVVGKINELVESGAIPKASAAAFYKTLDFKRFGFDLLVSGVIIGSGTGIRYYFNKKAEEAYKKGLVPSNEDVENSKLAEKVVKMNKNDFDNKILPIIDKYRDLYDNENENDLKKLRKIIKATLEGYIANPKSDLNAIATINDKN
jgi:cobalamin-dependent methionine synthase I